MIRTDKGWIVRRGVILCESPVGCSHEAANREVETWRTVLPLVVPIGRKLHDLVGLAGVTQDMGKRSVNFRRSLSAFLVGVPAGIGKTGQHDAVLDPREVGFVPAEPDDGPYGPGNKKKPVRKSTRESSKALRQERCDG
jgi:hypothetical protein